MVGSMRLSTAGHGHWSHHREMCAGLGMHQTSRSASTSRSIRALLNGTSDTVRKNQDSVVEVNEHGAHILGLSRQIRDDTCPFRIPLRPTSLSDPSIVDKHEMARGTEH